MANGICGGLAEGTLGGNTSIHIENAQVESVYGGNEYSGMVGGNTELFFGDGAVVNGWTYGGGAGREGMPPSPQKWPGARTSPSMADDFFITSMEAEAGEARKWAAAILRSMAEIWQVCGSTEAEKRPPK